MFSKKKDKEKVNNKLLIECYRLLSEYEILLLNKLVIEQSKLEHIKNIKSQINIELENKN